VLIRLCVMSWWTDDRKGVSDIALADCSARMYNTSAR
jgi:hypothetical protein